MNFWSGFFFGIAAVYGISVGALIVVVLIERRAKRRIERLLAPLHKEPEVIREDVCPEYPTVRFTHVTDIGDYVRGRDI